MGNRDELIVEGMSKIVWGIAGSLAAVVTAAVGAKLAMDDNRIEERPQRKRETQSQKTKRVQSLLRNSKHERPTWRNEPLRHTADWR